MKRIRYLMFVLLCAFLSPLVIKAQCTDQRMAELNKIAGNVQVSYYYDLDESGEPVFHVVVSNITDDIYVSYVTLGGLEDEIIRGTQEIVLDTYDGTDRIFSIYSNDPNCIDSKLTDKHLNIPTYNSLSQEQVCKIQPNFEYCKTWLNTSISLEQFNEEYEKAYKNVSIDNIKQEKKDINFSFLPIVLVIFTFLIIIICVILFFRRKKV